MTKTMTNGLRLKGTISYADSRYAKYLEAEAQAAQDKATLYQMAREGQPRPRLRAKDPEERRLARALRSFTTPPERVS